MTRDEFLAPYKDLVEHFGVNSFSSKRGALLFSVIKDLPAMWWVSVAHRMIRSNDIRFDIDFAARQEISNIRSVRRVKEETQAYDNFAKMMSECGLENTLEKFNSKSLWEAVEKNKKGDA